MGYVRIPKKKSLKRLGHLLRQSEFHFFMFCMAFLLLNWPFLGVFRPRGPGALLIYLFMVWVAFILMLFLMSRSSSRSGPKESEGEPKDSG